MSESKKRILFLAANPKDTNQLRFDQELRDVKEGINRSKNHELFDMKDILATRYDDLRRELLEYRPHIVHFIGHGDPNGIKLENDIGNSDSISTDVLSELFELCSDQVQCVILNACYTAAQAEIIRTHIEYVIGYDAKVEDRVAVKFSIVFYEAFVAGRLIDTAFKLGRNAIRQMEAFILPRLFQSKKHIKVAIISLTDHIEYLQNEKIDHPLALYGSFNGRSLVNGTWDDIKKKIESFLLETTKFAKRCDFYLPLHNSLAFLVGRTFPFRSGKETHIYQCTPQQMFWDIPASVNLKEKENNWSVKRSKIRDIGTHMAVVFSVSKKIDVVVKKFVKSQLINVSHLLHLKVEVPGDQSITNAGQAYGLSCNAIMLIEKEREKVNATHLHFFMAAPNTFNFRLGQKSSQLSKITLYDYDDSRSHDDGKYTPTINL